MPDHPADTADKPEDVATLRAALLAAEARIAALEQIIHSLKRARFGQSAERIDAAQLALTLGQDPPPPPANDPSAISAPASRKTQPRQRNRGALPAHLERVEHVLDLADKGCPCCGRQMHRIGEDRTERLDVVPAQLRVRVTIRPRYACRGCTDGVHQRRAPDHAIPGGLPTEALLAHVLMAKYGDGLPQVDGYDGFKALWRDRDDGEVVLAFCWAHLRRRFFDIHAATQSPIAAEALLRIAALYAIEAGIRGRTAEQRLAMREAQSAPLVAELEAWLHAQLNRLSRGSKLAEAIHYGLRHWQGLSEFLSDGRLEMDTNTVEREIRPVAVTRKAALFAGSEGGGENWAIATTLIRTAILNGVDPQAWLTDVLEQMVSGKVNSRNLASLLPWAWRDAKRAELAA